MQKRRAFEISPLPFEVAVALEALGQRIALAHKERKQPQRDSPTFSGLPPPPWLPSGGHPIVQIGHYARALWLLEIQDAFLGSFGLPEIEVAADSREKQP